MRFRFLAHALQPTKQSTTRTSEPNKTVKPVSLLILGIAFVALVTAIGIYYFVEGMRINRKFDKELTTEGFSLFEEVVGTQVTEGKDAGITHEAFVEDSDGSTNVAAPGPEVKVTDNDDFADKVTSF